MNKTLREVLSDNIDDPRLRQSIADETLQHNGHFKAVRPAYCPDEEFFLPDFHRTPGDEKTPRLDKVIQQDLKEIQKVKAGLRRRQKSSTNSNP